MVSITLGLILLAGVMSIFHSSKVTYNTNEKTARLQENGRVALDFLTHDLRSAGYLGCAREYRNGRFHAQRSTTFCGTTPSRCRVTKQTARAPGHRRLPARRDALNPAPVNDSDVVVVRSLLRDRPLDMQVETAGVAGTDSSTVLEYANANAAGQVHRDHRLRVGRVLPGHRLDSQRHERHDCTRDGGWHPGQCDPRSGSHSTRLAHPAAADRHLLRRQRSGDR